MVFWGWARNVATSDDDEDLLQLDQGWTKSLGATDISCSEKNQPHDSVDDASNPGNERHQIEPDAINYFGTIVPGEGAQLVPK
ncbi:hypothetical protein N9L68_05135 [bacterium]|nr:hypothetical protein [bacterium]